MTDFFKRYSQKVKELAEMQEELLNNAHNQLEGIEDEEKKKFLRDSLEAVKKGELNVNDFIKQVKDINNAS